jgi:hypothetical protein
LKYGVFFMTLLQAIVGDARAEMMDVMKADIAGKPLQYPGKLVV